MDRLHFVVLGGTNVIAETGTKLVLYGGLSNTTNGGGEYTSYPTGKYAVDGLPRGSLDRNAASPDTHLIPYYSRIPRASR